MIGIGPQGSPEVLETLERQVAAEPGNRVAMHNLGVELRKLDRSADSLKMFDKATALGLRAPETEVMRGHVLADLGRFEEAIRAYRRAAAKRPATIEAHEALANLLPQVGQGGEALQSYHEAMALIPQSGALWVSAMAAAKGMGDHAQLLAWADAAEARFGADTMVSNLAAQAMSALGRDAEAYDRLDKALDFEPDFAPAHNTMAHLLIRLGEPSRAAQAAGEATRLVPDDQSGWALLGVALRLMNDEREHWLCNYEELVMLIDVPLDAQLAANLEARHLARAHPADQSLRQGTQTRGNLFESADPMIQKLARDVQREIETRLRSLPYDSSHPFLARNIHTIEFSASWSVQLRNTGFHVSHIHPKGWMSSALYISLPEAVRHGEGQGELAFGVPDAALGLDLPPRRMVKPREGQLVVFPSYLWHGTTPFEDETPRLTVAFDALPVDNRTAQA
jgi:tetratricopeptide (TPR) repeat protein